MVLIFYLKHDIFYDWAMIYLLPPLVHRNKKTRVFHKKIETWTKSFLNKDLYLNWRVTSASFRMRQWIQLAFFKGHRVSVRVSQPADPGSNLTAGKIEPNSFSENLRSKKNKNVIPPLIPWTEEDLSKVIKTEIKPFKPEDLGN